MLWMFPVTSATRCVCDHPFVLQRELMLSNGCLRSSNVPQCRTVSNGVFTKGLHAVTKYYTSIVQQLVDSRLHDPARTVAVS